MSPNGDAMPRRYYSILLALLTANALLFGALSLNSGDLPLWRGDDSRRVAAYEQKLDELGAAITRLRSRQYVGAGRLGIELDELTEQQQLLVEQTDELKLLVHKATTLGIPVQIATSGDQHATLAADDSFEDGDAASVRNVLAEMSDETQLALSSLWRAASSSTDQILDQLKRLGVSPTLPPPSGVGGPLLPMAGDFDAAPALVDASAVMEAFEQFAIARQAIERVPIHMPLKGDLRMSSDYGTRRDPFTGKRAFHAGIDFAAAEGTPVLSAGEGTVSFVGWRSGYGNVVEVVHKDGLTTRYPHLSKALVAEGQAVECGTPIAEVGTTGRSTGPHLHFEILRNDKTIDPQSFLDVGNTHPRYAL